jgi:hypothetical protein
MKNLKDRMRLASGIFDEHGCVRLGNEENVTRKQRGPKTIRGTTRLTAMLGEMFPAVTQMTFL